MALPYGNGINVWCQSQATSEVSDMAMVGGRLVYRAVSDVLSKDMLTLIAEYYPDRLEGNFTHD